MHPNYNKLTSDHLKRLGFRIGKTESFNIFGGDNGTRHDLFNFIDLIAIKREPNSLYAIQSTSLKQKRPHLTKITVQCREAALDWLAAGGRIVLLCWSKLAKTGRNGRWLPDWQELTTADFAAAPQPLSPVASAQLATARTLKSSTPKTSTTPAPSPQPPYPFMC